MLDLTIWNFKKQVSSIKHIFLVVSYKETINYQHHNTRTMFQLKQLDMLNCQTHSAADLSHFLWNYNSCDKKRPVNNKTNRHILLICFFFSCNFYTLKLPLECSCLFFLYARKGKKTTFCSRGSWEITRPFNFLPRLIWKFLAAHYLCS